MFSLPTRKNPIGPEHGPWEHHEFDFSGTHIRLSVPKQNHEPIPENVETRHHCNIYNDANFSRYDKKDLAEPPHRGLLYKHWEYYGLPFIDGAYIGELKFSSNLSKMPEFANLFRPRRLECAIERYIYASSESIRGSGRSRHDWRVVEINGVQWVNYYFQGNPGFFNAVETTTDVWQTPISDQHLLTLDFTRIMRVERTRLNEAYSKLVNQIMGTVHITLSDDANSYLCEVRDNYPWERLQGSIPPYKFDEFDVMERFDLIEYVHSKIDFAEVPDNEFDNMVREEKQLQKQKSRGVKEAVLASHLRFESLEAEDLAAYRKKKVANT